jgi:hypothetical protein
MSPWCSHQYAAKIPRQHTPRTIIILLGKTTFSRLRDQGGAEWAVNILREIEATWRPLVVVLRQFAVETKRMRVSHQVTVAVDQDLIRFHLDEQWLIPEGHNRWIIRLPTIGCSRWLSISINYVPYYPLGQPRVRKKENSKHQQYTVL